MVTFDLKLTDYVFALKVILNVRQILLLNCWSHKQISISNTNE